MKNTSLAWAHPLVRDWFLNKFGSSTEPQEQGWPSILSGKSTLISAPTGSGKTFSAFLVCIDNLIRQALESKLYDETQVLYVSPLKALSNDIHTNLTVPLAEISQLAKERGLAMREIRVAVRTGDTLMKDRQAMLKKPPHILVTTPESLFILLTAEKSRLMLKSIKTIIVDEIHAMANDKRGAHLCLSLERLEAITHITPVRIGLSATQKPLSTVGKILVGNERPDPTIINIGHSRHLDLAIEVPASELSSVASNEMWDEIYERIAELAQQHRSTLVFVNTRRLAERVAHHLAEHLGEDQVAAHHGSLSRKIRLEVETKLKNGALKILVATASLELGIDIGMIDLVCQIGSPRSIAVALQRIGRAGHWRGAISKGRIFATTRGELLECAALVRAIREGDLDQLIIPVQPLDILSQQIIATCATGEWHEDDLFLLIKKSFHYGDLPRETFDEIIKMLADGIAGSRGRYGAYLHYDQVNGILKARRGSRLTAMTSGGAIPDNGLFSVVAEPEGIMVGTLDEDFAIESNRDDIILLGSTSWKIKRIESATGRVLVEDAKGAPPSVPFWRGEAPARTNELSFYVSKMLEDLKTTTTETITWLKTTCGLDHAGAEQLIDYIKKTQNILGDVPSQSRIIAERFFDESGGMQLIIHSPFGARINKAWGLALRKRFCRSFNFELQAAATDDGINISLAEQHSFPLLDVFHFLHANTVKEVVTQAVLQSPLFPTRWRWDAARALALVRFRNGKKVPPQILRMLSDDLLAAVFPDAAACQDNLGGKDIELPEHPLIRETMKDVLDEALDVEGLISILNKINDGSIQCLAVDTPSPSLFSHEILNANPYAFLDDAPLEERRARAVAMRHVLPESILSEVGKLDPRAIQEVKQQAWPDVRDADELHDALLTLIAFPMDFKREDSSILLWLEHLDSLKSSGRIGTAIVQNREFAYATEKAKTFLSIFPDAIIQQTLKPIEKKSPVRDKAVLDMLRGWLLHLGPTTGSEVSQILALEVNEVDQTFIQLETTGFLMRGQFTQTNLLEWCERRLLARIHRTTLSTLRKEIEPVSAAVFMSWLLSWQHVAPGTQLQGDHGLIEIIRQLQGYEIPANAWESKIFSKRIKHYTSDMLDRLCLMGIVGWGRLSPHTTVTRIIPTSVAPITFFIREESQWLSFQQQSVEEEIFEKVSGNAKLVYEHLKKNGASFFADIVRHVGRLKSEIESALWELVTAGLITADGFDNLRALIDPDRRLTKKRRRMVGPRHGSGRWSLLYSNSDVHTTPNIEDICWMLLRRYGVVFRDLILREKLIPRWRELLICFRKLEDRGEIRGGRFVDGFLGEQFALPYAVDSLRAMRKKERIVMNATISAADPLNLIGYILPGEKILVSSKQDIYL